MKVIITENQKVNFVKNLIKSQGWKESQKFFDANTIVREIFNNDPMEFLGTFDDLEMVQSGEAKKSFGIESVNYVEYFQPYSIRTKLAFIV